MSTVLKLVTFCLLASCLLLSAPTCSAQGQNQLTCEQSTSMALDIDKFVGTWWEVARQPANSYFCTEVTFSLLFSGVIDVQTTYSNTPLYPWVNQTMYANLTAQNLTSAPNGYNFSYWNPPNNDPYAVYKILDTDYTSYAFVCGYTNATDNSTSFGLILTRERTPSTLILNSLESNSSALYPNFLNGGMSLIQQDSTCHSGTSNIKLHSLVYVALFSLLLCYWKSQINTVD